MDEQCCSTLMEQGLNDTDKTTMLNVVRTILFGIVVLSSLDNIVVTILFGLDGCTMLFDAVGTRLNNTDKTTMLNVVGTILFAITQPETPQTCCKLWTLPACCKLSSSCSKPVDFIKLQQVCWLHQVASSLLTSSSCSKSVRIRLAASWSNNLQQVCDNNLQQIGFSQIVSALMRSTDLLQVDNFNHSFNLAASWYFQICCKLISQTCCKTETTNCSKFVESISADTREFCCKLNNI